MFKFETENWIKWEYDEKIQQKKQQKLQN